MYFGAAQFDSELQLKLPRNLAQRQVNTPKVHDFELLLNDEVGVVSNTKATCMNAYNYKRAQNCV